MTTVRHGLAMKLHAMHLLAADVRRRPVSRVLHPKAGVPDGARRGALVEGQGAESPIKRAARTLACSTMLLAIATSRVVRFAHASGKFAAFRLALDFSNLGGWKELEKCFLTVYCTPSESNLVAYSTLANTPI